MSVEDHLKIMLSLAREAGRIALSLSDGIRSELKADESVITEADRAVSRLAHQKLKGLIATGQHVLIDEEDPLRGDYLDDAFLDRTPYVWSIDPIDGTRVYANHMPHYGVSIGLIKDRKPYLGAVYFPALRELFYCDATNAWMVKRAFGLGEQRTRIIPVDEQLSSRSVMILSDEMGEDFTWHSADCRYMVFSSAVSEFCWPAAGRACGSLSRVHLWDFAGSWPIIEKAGLKFRDVATGKPLERLEAGLFHRSPAWKLKDFYLLSSERNFPLLRQRISFPSNEVRS
jgi:fructose-1,6-bisphosphatase/inositol monophosphatase family enzyme